MYRQLLRGILFLPFLLILGLSVTAQPNEVLDVDSNPNDLAMSSFGSTVDLYQSFTPTQDGKMTKLTVIPRSNSVGSKLLQIYEGEGTGGTLLHSQQASLVTGPVDITLINPVRLTGGQVYTFSLDNSDIAIRANFYSGGRYVAGGFNTFDSDFLVFLDIGTNVEISSADDFTNNSTIQFDVSFFGTLSGFDISDFTVTNGVASNLVEVSTNNYTVDVTSNGEGVVTLELLPDVANIHGIGNDAASASVTYDNTPPNNQDLILTENLFSLVDGQLLFDNASVTSLVYIAPEGTTDFTTSTSITQGTTISVIDPPGCVDDPGTTCPDPMDLTCVPIPPTICTMRDVPFINAPGITGEYRLFVLDEAGNVSEPSESIIYVLDDIDEPIFSTDPVTTATEDEEYSYSIAAFTRLGGANLDFSSSDFPDWLTLEGNVASTMAGTGTTDGFDGTTTDPLDTEFGLTRSAAYDGLGNVYLADHDNHVIWRLAANGTISLFAGTGTAGFSGDGGQATSAQLDEPTDLAVDSDNNVFVSESNNHRVRKIDVGTGVITTYAGNGTGQFAGDGGQAASASLMFPEAIAFDASDNLYIADRNNGRIRKVLNSTGVISTVAGNGSTTFSGEGTAATSAGIGFPAGVAVDKDLNIFISNASGHRVMKVEAMTGNITTLAGNGSAGFSGDGGVSTAALLNTPFGLAVDADGDVYIADLNNRRVRVVTRDGIINTVAGNGGNVYVDDVDALQVGFGNVYQFDINDEGQVLLSTGDKGFFAEISTNEYLLSGTPNDQQVGSFEVSLEVASSALTTTQDFQITVTNVNDEPDLIEQLNASTVATEEEAYEYLVYASDVDGDLVDMEVSSSPNWLEAALDLESFTFTNGVDVTDLTFTNNSFYLTDQSSNAIFRVDNLGGSLTRIAGQSDNSSGFIDGNGTAAAFETPFAIDVDSNGDLYVIDQDNHALRKISDLDGLVTVTTIAGNGSAGDATGAASASTATFDSPSNLLIASNDDIYIADAGNGVVKKLSGGTITTLQDGTGADFTFSFPYGLAIDQAGVLYVSDFGDHAIYSIDGTSRTLLAGQAGTSGSKDGPGSTARFDEPAGIITNGDGSLLYVVEGGNEAVRRIDIDGATVTVTEVSTGPSTPIGLIQNPLNGALLIADVGFSAITENYPAMAFSGTPTNDDSGPNEVVLALDDGNDVVNRSVNLHVNNTNDKPTFTSTAPTAVTEGEKYSYEVGVEDVDGDFVSITAETLPNWLSLTQGDFVAEVVVGDGVDAFDGDGDAALDASIGSPNAIAVDQEGNLFVAHLNRIRKINTQGVVSTIAGDGTNASTGDGGQAVNAELMTIKDMTFGPEGSLFIVTTLSGFGNPGVRKIALNGTISTVAGRVTNGTVSTGAGDGGQATDADFVNIEAIFVDDDGNLFIADQGDGVIRKVDTDGIVSTVATNVPNVYDMVVDEDGFIYYVNDGNGAGLTRVDENDVKVELIVAAGNFFATDLAIDNLGNIYATQIGNNYVLRYNIEEDEAEEIIAVSDVSLYTDLALGQDATIFLAADLENQILAVTQENAALSGTSSADDLGDNEVVLEVTDGTKTVDQSFTLTVNNVPEIVSVSSTTSDGAYREGTVIPITITFDGDIEANDLGNGDISLDLETGDTDQIASFGSVSGKVLTLNYEVQADDESGDLAYTSESLALNNYELQSPEGVDAVLTLPASGDSESLSSNKDLIIDTESPSVTLTTDANGTVNEDFEITITFSESVTGFKEKEVVIDNGTISDFTGSGTTYSAMVTPDASGDVTIDVAAGVAVDEADNGNLAANQLVVSANLAAPAVAITSSVTSPTNLLSIDITVTFDEEVSGFKKGDVAVSNGTIADFASTDATTYTFTLEALGEGTVTVDVAADVAEDDGGNGNTAASQFSIVIDQTSPTVTIDDVPSNTNEDFTATITFSEKVLGFKQGDIELDNGSMSDFTKVTGRLYTVKVTPQDEGPLTIDIADGIARDAAGNTNEAASQVSTTVDTTSPTTTISSSESSPTTSTSIPVTVAFSELVSDFEEADIVVENGTISDFAAEDNKTFTFILAPERQGEVTVDVPAGEAFDDAGNGNSAAPTFMITYSASGAADLIEVTMETDMDEVTGPFDVAIVFAEAVTGFALEDLNVTNGEVSNLTGQDAVYNATVTPSSSGEVALSIGEGVAFGSTGVGNAAQSITVEANLTDVLGTTREPSMEVLMYPNPTADLLFIDIEDGALLEVQVFDLRGRLLGHEIAEGNHYVLDVSHLNPGMYLIELVSGDKTHQLRFSKK